MFGAVEPKRITTLNPIFQTRRSAHHAARGGESHMTFSDWFEFARTNWKREEGQTMAEYGVVLAVITIGAVAVFTALSGGIRGALSQVIGLLPGAGS
jgi:Flp pilus assembly pilin Flp